MTEPVTNAQMMSDIKQTLGRVLQLNALMSRSSLASGQGMSYGGDRDLYTALGYTADPTYAEYVQIANRDGFGKRVNEAPCDAVWSKPPAVTDSQDKTDSDFEIAWKKLVKEFKLWSRFNRLDKLLGFGPYAVLLIGFDDVKNKQGYQHPVSKGAKPIYMQCYPAENAQIQQLVVDISDPRYGQPLLYNIKILDPNALNQMGGVSVAKLIPAATTASAGESVLVHYSRILHVLEGNLDNEVYGEPRLKVPYNRLQDIEKVVGGAAEMFWRGARPGYTANIKEDYNFDPAGNDPAVADMKKQLDEYEHNLRRILTLQGVEMKGLDMQLAVDPVRYLDMQLQDLSAGTGIPKRLLTGSERGELASTQDRDSWFDLIDRRREWYASPIIVQPFVDKMIELGVLPAPIEGDYEVMWPDLKSQSEKDRAEVGRVRAEALRAYVQSIGSDAVMPPEAFLQNCMGFDEPTAQDVITQREAYLGEQVQQEVELDTATLDTGITPQDAGVQPPAAVPPGKTPPATPATPVKQGGAVQVPAHTRTPPTTAPQKKKVR
jgi:uncharacterized protein